MQQDWEPQEECGGAAHGGGGQRHLVCGSPRFTPRRPRLNAMVLPVGWVAALQLLCKRRTDALAGSLARGSSMDTDCILCRLRVLILNDCAAGMCRPKVETMEAEFCLQASWADSPVRSTFLEQGLRWPGQNHLNPSSRKVIICILLSPFAED